MARAGGYDYFTTTLSISPLKNAEKLNEIGEKLGEEYQVKYLFSDFKKRWRLTSVRRSCRRSTDFTGRITAAACTLCRREEGSRQKCSRKEYARKECRQQAEILESKNEVCYI